MKKFIKITAAIIGVIILSCAFVTFYLTRDLDTQKNLTIHEINLTHVKDGKYTGQLDAGRFSNQLEITVNDHKISDIHIVKDVRFSQPNMSSALFNKVIQSQSTLVDTISGATATSKSYLKSIENAVNMEGKK